MGFQHSAAAQQLSAAELRALSAFLEGRLPAGQLHAALLLARGEREDSLALPANGEVQATGLRQPDSAKNARPVSLET
jgi:hypothetical protein